MQTVKGLLILLGYVVSYVAGIVICYVAVVTIFHAGNDFTTLENALAWGLGIFFVAPGLAFGYHRLVDKYKYV